MFLKYFANLCVQLKKRWQWFKTFIFCSKVSSKSRKCRFRDPKFKISRGPWPQTSGYLYRHLAAPPLPSHPLTFVLAPTPVPTLREPSTVLTRMIWIRELLDSTATKYSKNVLNLFPQAHRTCYTNTNHNFFLGDLDQKLVGGEGWCYFFLPCAIFLLSPQICCKKNHDTPLMRYTKFINPPLTYSTHR